MFVEIEGVVNVVPVPKAVPPVAAENHDNVPIDAVAFKATVPVPHLLPGVVAETEGVWLIVM